MKARIITALVVIAVVFAVLIVIAVHKRSDQVSSETETAERAGGEDVFTEAVDVRQPGPAPAPDAHTETRETSREVSHKSVNTGQAGPAVSRAEMLRARVTDERDAEGWRVARALPAAARGVGPVRVRTVESTRERVSLAYRMPKARVVGSGRVVKGLAPEGTARVRLGNAPSRSRMGEPMVPVVSTAIVLPPGRDLDRIEITALGREELQGTHVLEPGRKPIPLDPEAAATEADDDPDPVDAAIYGRDLSYPAQRYEIVGVQKKRGVRMVMVNLLPVEYKPKSGKVAVYNEMSVQVTTKPAAAEPGPSPRYRPDPLRPLSGTVDNPDTLEAYRETAPAGGAVPLGICDPADSYAYVLVTSEAIRDAGVNPSVYNLLTHRQNQGLTATAVTIESILAGYGGVDDAEKLRNFILDAYNNWETDYVLLGGDIDVVPMRKLYVETWPGSSYREDMPSDLYFQCLDGSYNSDEDGKWGEPTDGPGGADVDLAAEVYIGRASAETAEELSNWMFKTLAYEMTPPDGEFLTSALMVGEYLGANFGPDIFGYGKSYMEEIRLGSDRAGYTTLGFVANPAMTVDTLYDYDLESNWPKSEIISRLNSNTYSLINHLGHANFDYVMRFRNGDADALYNEKYFFLNSQGCIPGAFDKDCMSEHLTTSTRHGAFAVVLNSRYGWGNYNNSWEGFDGPSQRFQRQFWHAVFGDYVQKLGVLNALSHERNIWGIHDDCIRWCYYETNLQGDPACRLNAAPAGEYLMVKQTTAADSGGDGLVNPGESAALTVRLVNLGIDDAENVTGTLSTTDPHVTVTSAEASYGTVPAQGGEKDSAPPYTIQVAADSPTPRQAEFKLVLESGAGVTTNVLAVWIVKSCEVSGLVRLDGSPVGGVTVSVWSSACERSTETAADGTYSLVTSDGPVFRQASKAGWLSTEAISLTANGDMSNQDFDFTTATVSGTVRDETGTPVPDATVIYSGALNGETVSGADGSYAFAHVYGQPTTLDLYAKKDGYVSYTGFQAAVPPDVAAFDLKLYKMWTIRGRVTWGGEGAPGIKVHNYGTLGAGVTSVPAGATVTDADGNYVVYRWPNPPGYEYGCGLASWGDAGMGYVHASPVKHWGQSEMQVPDFTYNIALNKPAIGGTVKDKVGHPVAGAEIHYSGQASMVECGDFAGFRTFYYIDGTVTSGPDGSYSIPLVQATDQDIMLNVNVSCEGYAPSSFAQTVNTADVTRDVVLGRPAMQVDTESIEINGYHGELSVRTVRISNTGDGGLEYAVVKDADPAKAWQIVWERDIPPNSRDYPSPDAPAPDLAYGAKPAWDADGRVWCLCEGRDGQGLYMCKLETDTFRVSEFFRVHDYDFTQDYWYVTKCSPTTSGDLIWWFFQDRILAFNKHTGARVREFVLPRHAFPYRVTARDLVGDNHWYNYSSYLHTGTADDGYLYGKTSGYALSWENEDNIWDCRASEHILRLFRMDAVTGAIINLKDLRQETYCSPGTPFMWNGTIPMWQEDVYTGRSRQDWREELVNMGMWQCYWWEHPTDDAYWYGIDPGPTQYDAAGDEPRPTWGADRPTLSLRTSGVAPWLGKRIAHRSGVVPPGGHVDIEVAIDAAKAALGTHTSRLIIDGNDPGGRIEIPITLNVGGIVEIAEVSTGSRCEVADAAVGTRCYADRRYRILQLDPSLAGGLLVRTADKDKYVTASEHLKLNLVEPATVSVCVDARISTLPAWLDGSWTDRGTGVVIEGSDGAASPMEVFQKSFAAGWVVLGGNGVGTPGGDRSHYVVIVNP